MLENNLREYYSAHVLREVVQEQPVGELAAIHDADHVVRVELAGVHVAEYHGVELERPPVQEVRYCSPDNSYKGN